ncbi:MAG: SusC/RagA family TonB-linked outer membrane protein [Chitinophagaceae bacterium]
MNAFKRLLIAVMIIISSIACFAQSKIITGRILSDENTPLAGVTVRVKNTDRITQTNASGVYSISASPGEKLVFTYVGYELSELNVGNSTTLDGRLTKASNTLEPVTVAMDIKRNPKELGYSVQKVSGAELAETQRENFLNSMQGRVSGLTITPTGGAAGASSQIVLRGFNSLALDNSPLFIIDGIIVDNQTLSENHGGGGARKGLGLASAQENRSNDYNNRIGDINPNDIETITVLKGPEATALYGSQAASGAIVITTKRANTNGVVSITYDNSFRWQKLTRFPEISNTFSTGVNGVPSSTLQSDYFNYFGPAYPTGTTFYNNIDAFFQTGFAQTHNLSVGYGKKNYTVRFSGSFFDQEAVVPTNTFTRYNARLSGSVKIGKYIDVIPSVSYIRSENDKPLRGAGGYMLNLLIWPGTNDINDYESDSGYKKPLYLANPNAEIDNPLFNVNRTRSADLTDRIIGTLGLNINPFTWLSLAGRFGYDTYRTEGNTQYHPMSFYVTRASGGQLTNYYRNYDGYNHTLTGTVRKELGDFSGRLLVGNMWQDYRTEMYSVTGTGLIDSVGVNNRMYKNGKILTQEDYENIVGNGTDSSVTRTSTRIRLTNAFRNGGYNYSINRQSAYFGEASIGWRSAIFLTYSHRFEESSIFPKQFRKYNYPAGSLSIVMSDLFPTIRNNTLSYWKLRGSLASTARSSAPYANQSVFAQNTGSGGGNFYGFTNANPLLEPERQQTFEVGTEIKLIKNRLSVDATYYNTKNKNLIVELFRASYGTGFVLNTLNVGSNLNTGVEISIDATPVQRSGFRWNTRLNFNRMRNEVTSLPANVPEFYISDTWLFGNARGGLIVGGPTTAITGFGYQRNNKGNILINPTNGQPLRDDNFRVRGDRNPDFTLGFLNNLSYKNFRLNILWDIKAGGDIFNATEMYLTRAGKSLRTEDRLMPRVIDGVLSDGLQNTANPTRNTIAIIPYYNQQYYTLNMPEEEFIEKDINWLRLRDVTLNYTFSPARTGALKFVKSLSAFVTGNDLILITNYTGADPAVNGNTAGTRGVGAFGFDYGNIGTPISVNVGLRANF